MNLEEKVKELADLHCPAHNEIDPEREEGHYHCEECADIIRGRFEFALRSALSEGYRMGLEEAAKRVVKVAEQCDEHGTKHFCEFYGCQTWDKFAAELRRLAQDSKLTTKEE